MRGAIRATCVECSSELVQGRDTFYALARGWVKVRTQGGPNQLSAPIYEGEFLCGPCHGIRGLVDPDQLELPL